MTSDEIVALVEGLRIQAVTMMEVTECDVYERWSGQKIACEAILEAAIND